MSEDKNPYQLPEGWVWTTIKDVTLKVTDGSHNPPRKEVQGIPMLSARNITNNNIDFKDVRYISDEAFTEEYRRANIDSGDVLLTIVATIGRVTIVPKNLEKKFAIQRSIALLKPASGLSGKFLMYAIQAPFFQQILLENAKGTAQKGVYLGTLNSLPIPICSTKQQDSITEKIEELFSALDKSIESLEKAKRQLEVYRQVLLKDAFEGKLTEKWRKENTNSKPWKTTIFSNVGNLISGQHILEKDYNTKSIGTPYLTGPSDFGQDSPIATRWTEYPKVIANPNTILITVKGSGVGKLNMLNFQAAIGRQIMSFDPLENNKWFIYYYLQSQFKTMQGLSSGTAIPGISRKHILSLIIPIVSEIEQNEIVRELQTQFSLIDNLEKTIETNISRLESLKKSVLNSAFKGRLVSEINSVEENLLNKIKAEKTRFLVSSKHKKSKTSPKVMRKKLTDLIMEKFNDNPFTYEDLYNEINLPYDQLKSQLFELLDLKRLSSKFDKKKERIFYTLLK